MKIYKKPLFSSNRSRLCSLFSLYDMLWLNNIHVSSSEILLMNLTSLINFIEFQCNDLHLFAIAPLEARTEINCFDVLGIPYELLDDKKIIQNLANHIPVLCYMYREMNVRRKDYYIGAIHSGVLVKLDNQKILLSHVGETVELDQSDWQLLQESRQVTLYPYSPQKKAYSCLSSDKQYINEVDVNRIILIRLHEMIYSFETEKTKVSEYHLKCVSGIAVYDRIKTELDKLGRLGNDIRSNKYFIIQMFIIQKAFIENTSFFRNEIVEAFIEYGNKTNNVGYIRVAEELSKSIEIFDNIYKKIKSAREEVNKKDKFICSLVDLIDELAYIDKKSVNTLKQFI